MVGAKALMLDPDVSSTVLIGGDSRANSDVAPMLDIRYFITRDISLGTIWGYSKQKLRALGIAFGDMSLGTTKILPFSLTAQYNSQANNQISTCVGVGLNYMLFVDGFPGEARDVNYDDRFVTVFNLGLDYFLDDGRFFNIDVKNTHFNCCQG